MKGGFSFVLLRRECLVRFEKHGTKSVCVGGYRLSSGPPIPCFCPNGTSCMCVCVFLWRKMQHAQTEYRGREKGVGGEAGKAGKAGELFGVSCLEKPDRSIFCYFI